MHSAALALPGTLCRYYSSQFSNDTSQLLRQQAIEQHVVVS